MVLLKYELVFEKKTAKLDKNAMKIFATEVLKGFGGLDLLSNISINSSAENKLEIRTTDEFKSFVHVALMMLGNYKEVKCCFRDILDIRS